MLLKGNLCEAGWPIGAKRRYRIRRNPPAKPGAARAIRTRGARNNKRHKRFAK